MRWKQKTKKGNNNNKKKERSIHTRTRPTQPNQTKPNNREGTVENKNTKSNQIKSNWCACKILCSRVEGITYERNFLSNEILCCYTCLKMDRVTSQINDWQLLYKLLFGQCIRMQSKFFFLGSLNEHHFVNQSKGHPRTTNRTKQKNNESIGPIDLKWLYSIRKSVPFYIVFGLTSPFFLSYVWDEIHLHTIKHQYKQITNWCISIARKLANLSGNY